MKDNKPSPRRSTRGSAGNVSQCRGHTLTSFWVGALPIVDHFLRRAKIEEVLNQFVRSDKRCKLAPVAGILVLLKNYLLCREPAYGVGEWASRCLPKLLGLADHEVELVSAINDDRIGRCLDRLFLTDCTQLVLALTRRVVKEFKVDLDEFHNDSTTVTLFGRYDHARKEGTYEGKKTPAITWGHNKDHRPDLKQLLYNLTVTADGAVPVVFGIENGNVTDDKTHQETWELLCRIVGGADFLYVADSKLATKENMSYIANRGGRFLSVLPRTRAEDESFREQMLQGVVQWVEVDRKYDEYGTVTDVISMAKGPWVSAQGYRLLWYRSTRKIELDRLRRGTALRRAQQRLDALRVKLQSPRTRYREESQVAKAVAKILSECGATPWLRVEIFTREAVKYVQETPGRPGPKTRHRKEVRKHFDIVRVPNAEAIERAEKLDGIFPLVTNDRRLTARDALRIYKRQPYLEARFSQFKTAYEVAPVYLKSVQRVVGLLSVYYLVLLVEALIEREVRRAMKRESLEALPLYL